MRPYKLIGLAVNYARDFVAPSLQRRAPNAMEAEALRDLDRVLAVIDEPGQAGAAFDRALPVIRVADSTVPPGGLDLVGAR